MKGERIANEWEIKLRIVFDSDDYMRMQFDLPSDGKGWRQWRPDTRNDVFDEMARLEKENQELKEQLKEARATIQEEHEIDPHR